MRNSNPQKNQNFHQEMMTVREKSGNETALGNDAISPFKFNPARRFSAINSRRFLVSLARARAHRFGWLR